MCPDNQEKESKEEVLKEKENENEIFIDENVDVGSVEVFKKPPSTQTFNPEPLETIIKGFRKGDPTSIPEINNDPTTPTPGK